MAERLESYTFTNSHQRYPWNDWFDGAPWRLKKDEDYRNLASFRNGASREARKRGKSIKTEVKNKGEDNEMVVFQAFDKS